MNEECTDERYALDLLRRFVGIHTENGNEKAVADVIHGLFEQRGIKSEVLELDDDPTRANLVAEVGHGAPVLALVGHMDTVSARQKGWRTDPFELVERDGMLYGRGTTDMKAGLAAMVIAMMSIKTVEDQMHGTVRFMATAGEEGSMEGARSLQAQGYMDDVEAMLIGESTGYTMVYASKGDIDLNVTMRGKAAHSSTPELGVNAVENLLEFLGSVSRSVKAAAEGKTDEDLGGTVFNIDVITGGAQVNTIPERAEAGINIRVVPQFGNKAILKVLDEEVARFNASHEAEVSYETDLDAVAVVGAKESRLNSIIKSVADEELARHGDDRQVGLVSDTGTTDASMLLADDPVGRQCILFGPGNDSAHNINESVSKAMYLEFIDMYRNIVRRYTGVE